MRLDEVKNLNHGDDFIFGVAVGFDGESIHCSILYKWDTEIRTIDFYNQTVRKNRTIGDFGHQGFLYVKYDKELIIDVLALQVPSLCEIVKERNDSINFGIRFNGTKFNSQGELIYAEGDFGLTCATFVMAILNEAFGFEIINQSEWKSRTEDIEWQKSVLSFYKKKNIEEVGYYSEELIPHYEKNIGCFRFRPEEIGAASGSSTLPVGFTYCEEYGRRIIDALTFDIETYNNLYNSSHKD